MRRFLVVGCGGSGGATLAYLMDQLRSDLAAHGVHKLPAGWQFVHIDVPTTSDTAPGGLGGVQDQGGLYFGCSPLAAQYSVLDKSVSDQLGSKGALELIGTWAPTDPGRVGVSISVGAGQYRAVGRMITLSRAARIREVLQAAVDRLNYPETITEMSRLRVPGMGDYDGGTPIMLVVSSMAGGAGASMALDICRILSQIQHVDSKLCGVFMVAPNIFDQIPPAERTGVRANALAMLGEIVASQTGAAQQHDVAALEALGLPGGAHLEIPFARVFPVGRFVGVDGQQFGDGSQDAVYRGLGRGLAALMGSEKALKPFVSFDLGNTASPVGNRDLLGWGCDWPALPWGSFGFASLSMGRDRYAEYAAQRIARSCVDRLLTAHMQPGNRAPSTEQAEQLLHSQWETVCRYAGLPSSGPQVDGWMRAYSFPTESVGIEAQMVIQQRLEPYIPEPSGIQAPVWLNEVARRLNDLGPGMAASAEAAATRLAFLWHRRLLDLVELEVSRNLEAFGLPYAVAVCERLANHLANGLAPAADLLAKRGSGDVARVPETLRSIVSRMKGSIVNSAQHREQLVNGCREHVHRYIHAAAAEKVGLLLRQFSGDVLKPLGAALAEAQRTLEVANEAKPEDVGLARLATEYPTAWPSDSDDHVAARFDEADNEVLLTSSEHFHGQYTADLVRAITLQPGDPVPRFGEARVRVASSVISGNWKSTSGLRPPGGMLVRTTEWRPRAFPTDPNTHDPLTPSLADYDVHVRPKELLERARLFVARPGESFDEFCRMSITEFVAGHGASDTERASRRRDLVEKFRHALTLALPLISVNNVALQAVHPGTEIEYRYKFSEVPFKGPIGEELIGVLRTNHKIDHASEANLDKAIGDTPGITKIDIFGSYPNYSPLAFDAVLKPVSDQWAAVDNRGRAAWWQWRRSRPLAAALPMADSERRTMVAGWLLGLVTGRIRVPNKDFGSPVRIWDGREEARRWADFPHPLLTPPDRFRHSSDWLPAVLESVLLAIARSHVAPVMASMRPYQLLRELYDNSPDTPGSGPMSQLSAWGVLNSWLAGENVPDGRSTVPGADEAITTEERAKLATDWLTEIRKLAGGHFMAPGSAPGVTGGGKFSVIASRMRASETPLFRDVAPDVHWAAGELLTMLSQTAGSSGGPLDDPDLPNVPGF